MGQPHARLADAAALAAASDVVVSALALAWRWQALRSEAQLDAVLSRESFFVLNNVLLVGCAFVVLWGTVFGQISDAAPVQALYGKLGMEAPGKVQLGEPWFNRVMTPLGLALLALTGIGPLISWRRATRKNFEKNFAKPLVVSSLAALQLHYSAERKPLACFIEADEAMATLAHQSVASIDPILDDVSSSHRR